MQNKTPFPPNCLFYFIHTLFHFHNFFKFKASTNKFRMLNLNAPRVKKRLTVLKIVLPESRPFCFLVTDILTRVQLHWIILKGYTAILLRVLATRWTARKRKKIYNELVFYGVRKLIMPPQHQHQIHLYPAHSIPHYWPESTFVTLHFTTYALPWTQFCKKPYT